MATNLNAFYENCCVWIQVSLKYIPMDPINTTSTVLDNGLAPNRGLIGLTCKSLSNGMLTSFG